MSNPTQNYTQGESMVQVIGDRYTFANGNDIVSDGNVSDVFGLFEQLQLRGSNIAEAIYTRLA